jgi:glutamate dehydrogenase (NAD(P)+)
MDRAFANVMHRSARDNVPHRVAATAIGVERVQAAKRARGLFP